MTNISYSDFTIKVVILLILIFIIHWFFYLSIDSFNNTNEYILPKKIFAYWDDISKNKYIKYHFENWQKKFGKDWEIHIINKETVPNYVSKEFINKYKDLEPFRFSDFLRLELLRTNGGVWIDAGTLIRDPSFLDNFRNELLETKADALLFEYTENTADKNTPYLENWFIMAPKNSKLIIDWLNEFNRAYEMGFLTYKFNVLIPSGITLKNTIGYGLNTYLMQHANINYLMSKNKYNIIIKIAEDSMFKIHVKMNWNNYNIINYIIDSKDISDIYAIKLTSPQRHYITNDNVDKYIEAIQKI